MRNLWFIGLLLTCFHLRAQTPDVLSPCAVQKQHQLLQESTPMIADIREEDYNLLYIKLDLNVSNLNTALSGSAITRARAIKPNLTEYVFELIPEYIIDSVKVNNQIVSVTTVGVVRTAQLATAVSSGEVFEAQVWYHGEALSPYTGIRTQTNNFWNVPVTYTISEPYFANQWWPCKQALKDKIDSSDVWLTVPQDLKAGSNGILTQVTPMPDNKSRYEWKSRNPINYYLISLAVTKYIDYSYYVHFDNSTDSMLVQNYVYDFPTVMDSKPDLDSTAGMIRCFSNLIGRYPFWKEKYGICFTPLGGGMEHQTMSTVGSVNYLLLAHELAHQWFGDNVSIASWNDIWLAESFATYLSWIYTDYSRGDSLAFATMKNMHANVMEDTSGSVYCPDTTNVSRIFSGRLSYNKGCAVIHSLRGYFNNDPAFFLLLRIYQEVYRGGNASTQQFKQLAETAIGHNLDTFFNQWIYGEGYPIYSASWNQTPGQVILKLQQESSTPSSIPFFTVPLQVKFFAGGADTTVTFYNNHNGQQFAFDWDEMVDSIEIDPRNYIINQVDTIQHDGSLLSIKGINGSLFSVYPNPAGEFWKLEGLPLKCSIKLTDVSGRTLWKGSNGLSGFFEVDARKLRKGVYFLRVQRQDHVDQTVKLLK